MFICGMVLQCAGTIKPSLSLDQLQQICKPIRCFDQYQTSSSYNTVKKNDPVYYTLILLIERQIETSYVNKLSRIHLKAVKLSFNYLSLNNK